MTVRTHSWRLRRRHSSRVLTCLVLLVARLTDMFDSTLSHSFSESVSVGGFVEVIPTADLFEFRGSVVKFSSNGDRRGVLVSA